LFIFRAKFILMKAPKGIKKYATGGIVYQEDPKKKKVVTTEGVNTPNPNFPTAAEQMAAKGLINPTTADILKRTNSRINSGGITTGNRAVLGIQNAGGLQQDTKQLIPNDLGTFDPNTGIQYGFDGKVIQAKASGGKIMKAPKGIKVKGYLLGGEVEQEREEGYSRANPEQDRATAQLDANGNPILSNNTLPLTNGTEFKTQGDYPLTTAASGEPSKTGVAKQKTGSGLMSKVGSSLGWMQYANMAKEEALATVKKDTITDPTTGKDATGYKDFKGQATQVWATPTHTKIIDEAKAGNYGQALLSSDPLLGNALYYSNLRKGNEAYNQGLENIETEKKNEGNKVALNDALAARERGEVGYNAVNPYRRDASIDEKKVKTKENALTRFGDALNFAKGGKIVGAGTPKSDSINAKIEDGSFVVPAENAKEAEIIRKVVLKKAPKMKANLKQAGGENVKLSNGEHLFTPNEVSKIEASGIDLDRLAPDADNDEYYSDGGKIPVGTVVNGATWNGKNWTMNGAVFTDAGGKQYEDTYFKNLSKKEKESVNKDWLKEKADKAEANSKVDLLREFESLKGKKDEYSQFRMKEIANKLGVTNKAPVKSASELDKLKQAPSDKLGKPVLKAPSVKKAVAKTNGITNENYVAPQDLALVEQLKTPNVTNENYVAPQDLALVEQLKTPNVTKETVNDPNLDKYNKDLKEAENRTPQGGGDKGKSWKAWSPMFGNYLGNAIETGASLAQIKLGRDALNKAGVRPVGEIDPSFQANVDRAHAQSKYGFTAEQNALINQENQNATNAARFAARNYSGGSGGNAFNMERSAINEGWGRGLQAKIANTNLMLDKQQLDNQLSLQKAEMSRQLFEDKMDAFQQNQQAGALLKQTGWKNLIGATRYASALNSINQQNQLGQ